MVLLKDSIKLHP